MYFVSLAVKFSCNFDWFKEKETSYESKTEFDPLWSSCILKKNFRPKEKPLD